MVKQILDGKNISEIIPVSSESTVYYNYDIAKKFNISLPVHNQ